MEENNLQITTGKTNLNKKAQLASSHGSIISKYLPVIIVLILGLSLSVSLFYVMRTWEDKRLKDDFEQKVNTYSIMLQGTVSRSKGMLRSLGAFHASRCSVDERGYLEFAREFRDFTSCSLSCHVETQMLGWAPKIEDADRKAYVSAAKEDGFPDFEFIELSTEGTISKSAKKDEYYPLYNVAPFEANKSIFGYDLSSNPLFYDALLKSRDSGEITASEWTYLIKEDKKLLGVMLFLPLYKKAFHHDTMEARREYLDGFAVGFFQVSEMMEVSLSKLNFKGIDVYMYDESSQGSRRFVYRSDEGEISSIDSIENEKDAGNLYGLHSSISINVGGRKWTILFHPTEEYIAGNKNQQVRGYFALGFLFTTIMLTYLLIAVGRTSYIERLVDKRTEELATINKQLENEIFKHQNTSEALSRAEIRAQTLIESARDIIMTLEPDSTIATLNPAFEAIIGYKPADYTGRKLNAILHPDDNEYALLMFNQALQGRRTPLYELRLLSKDGETIVGEFMTSPKMELGKIVGVSSIVRDITDRKKIENEYETLQSQLLQSQKMESIGRLAGGIAHDFNNMLTGIIGYAELALSDIPEDHPAWKKLQIIDSTGRKAGELTKQLLAFSRKQVLDMYVVNPNSIIKNISKLLTRLVGDDIELALNTKPHVGKIMADAGQIEQVLMNLVVNARDAMPDGGYITISTDNEEIDEEFIKKHNGSMVGYYTVISVSDTGIGMSREVQDHVFEPFYTTKPKGKGTGLGLSTVFGIVKQHNGYITIDSAPGNGATFKIYFPISAGRTTKVHKKEDSRELKAGTETILAVDDESFVLDFVCDTLKPLGYNILAASNSDDAMILSYITKGKIDLLLTNVVLKGVSGKDLAKAIKAKRPNIKVILTSGYTEEMMNEQGIMIKGVNYLPKPLTPESLVGKLREVLDSDNIVIPFT